MKTATMAILGVAAAGAAYLFLTRKSGTGGLTSSDRVGLATQATTATVAAAPRAGITGRGAYSLFPPFAQSAPSAGGPAAGGFNARDGASTLAAAGAGAGCAAIPGVGVAAAPLCAMGGAWAGGKIYDTVSGWF